MERVTPNPVVRVVGKYPGGDFRSLTTGVFLSGRFARTKKGRNPKVPPLFEITPDQSFFSL
jgi:hypothetical protein